MISVIVGTDDSERALVPTLAALVPGAAAGAVREVIVADGGSRDQTAEVADIAGCRLMVSPGPLGGRLRAAAAAARSSWLMFLRPGIVPDPAWIAEATHFVESHELRGLETAAAAVFRPAPSPGTARPALIEALVLLRAAFGWRPRPDQGLLISKRLYGSLGGHHDAADAEADLLRRLGRRRIVMLRCGAVAVQ
jgi:glycosyltransferase involved in cell wall biosynthesis